jgi:Sap, sulfolipid-1-addressing protein
VNAAFFALAFTAALNPKLLAIDLLLVENRRPRAMFVSILAGGIATGVTIGLIDVLIVHADRIKSLGKPSAAVDLVLGLILLGLGVLVLTGAVTRLRATRQARRGRPKKAKIDSGDSWATRVLREPRLGLAVVIGVVVGLPGAAYLSALHNLVAGKYSTATQIVAVFVFVIIELLLIIIPWLCLEFWPTGTAVRLKRAQDWLTGHVAQLLGWICILLGAYLTISAAVRLS